MENMIGLFLDHFFVQKFKNTFFFTLENLFWASLKEKIIEKKKEAKFRSLLPL